MWFCSFAVPLPLLFTAASLLLHDLASSSQNSPAPILRNTGSWRWRKMFQQVRSRMGWRGTRRRGVRNERWETLCMSDTAGQSLKCCFWFKTSRWSFFNMVAWKRHHIENVSRGTWMLWASHRWLLSVPSPAVCIPDVPVPFHHLTRAWHWEEEPCHHCSISPRSATCGADTMTAWSIPRAVSSWVRYSSWSQGSLTLNWSGVPAFRERLQNNMQANLKVPGGKPAENRRDFKCPLGGESEN